jgi:betaine-aldehyde dehydrogenase
MQKIRNWNAGGPVDSARALRLLDKTYPATGEVIAQIELADDQLLDETVRLAKSAQEKWAASSGQERGRIMARAGQRLIEANEELAALEVRDVGKLYSEAVSGDVPSGSEAFEFAAALAMTQSGTAHRWPGALGYTERVPLGVCAGIGAWNYPAQIACWKAAPALATGNAFILKPAEETPLVAARIAELLAEAGIPDGLFNVLYGDHELGAAICRHPGIAKISLTGGVETGKLILEQSAASLKKVTLELGGKAPLLVFADADFDLAVQTALDANFYTAGEVCSNATRVFVEQAILPDFLAALKERAEAMQVGDPMDPNSHLGALISAAHLQKVLDFVAIGKKEGARLICGGEQLFPPGFEGGHFMMPTIFADCHDQMRIVREEIFGPVMSVLSFDSEEEAIARANDSDFGLGAGLVTRDLARAHRVAAALKAGNIWVNSYNLIPPDWPFGGSGQSGFGRESSAFALESYTEVKATYIQL